MKNYRKEQSLINKLLNGILIDVIRDRKLTRSQSRLIDVQYGIAYKIISESGGTLTFKFIDRTKKKTKAIEKTKRNK